MSTPAGRPTCRSRVSPRQLVGTGGHPRWLWESTNRVPVPSFVSHDRRGILQKCNLGHLAAGARTSGVAQRIRSWRSITGRSVRACAEAGVTEGWSACWLVPVAPSIARIVASTARLSRSLIKSFVWIKRHHLKAWVVVKHSSSSPRTSPNLKDYSVNYPRYKLWIVGTLNPPAAE